MFEQAGIISKEMFESLLPGEERRKRGPYAVMECFQNIPCNPCNTSCNMGAVRPMEDINENPSVDTEKCNGCARCVAVCPGLACFVIDEMYADDIALIKLPYEMFPLPEAGTAADALNRLGEVVGKAEILHVRRGKSMDKTSVVTIAVPKELMYDVRSIRVSSAV